MHLHCAVGRFADEAVGVVVTHRNLVGEFDRHFRLRHLVHFPGGLEDQQAEHLGLRGELHQRELDRLVGGQRLAEGLAPSAYFTLSLMQ